MPLVVLQMRESLTEEALQRAKREAEERARTQLQAMMNDKNKSEAERKKLQKILDNQHAEVGGERLTAVPDSPVHWVLTGPCVLSQVERYMEEMEKERQEVQELEDRLQQMQSKMIHGGVNLLEKDEELDKEKKVGDAGPPSR